MPKFNTMLANGEEEEDMAVSKDEADSLKRGFLSGGPFAFVDDDGVGKVRKNDTVV